MQEFYSAVVAVKTTKKIALFSGISLVWVSHA